MQQDRAATYRSFGSPHRNLAPNSKPDIDSTQLLRRPMLWEKLHKLINYTVI